MLDCANRDYKARNRKYLLLIVPIACCIFYAAIQLSLPIMVEKFIDIIAYSDAGGGIVIFKYCILVFLMIVFRLLKGYTGKRAALRITDQIRYELLKKSLSRGQVFYNKYSQGDILEVAEKDIDILDDFIINTLIPVFVDVFTLTGIFVFFFIKNIFLCIGSILLTFTMNMMIYIIQKQKSNAISNERKQSTKVTSFIGEIMSAKKEIYVMKADQEVISRIDKLFDKLRIYKIEKQKYLYRVWTCTLVALLMVNVVSFIGGGFLYSKRIITFGFVYVLYSYGNMLKSPLENMQNYIQSYIVAKESVGRINSIINFDYEISKGHLFLENKISSIKIERVFHKFDREYVLKDISFEIGNGEKLGIFGDSGSGKSTLCKIISKLYEIQEGNVYINQINIKEINTENLRNHVAYLTAGDQIFSTSLKNNLDMFSGLDFEEVIRIINNNGLAPLLGIKEDDDIYEKLRKELNINELSSGQKQLINLMRLFFCTKDFVIFDEAAANICEDIEKEYFDLLDRLSVNNILIIVTHNVERLERCDQILMLKDGCIKEYGTRLDLENDEASYYCKYSGRIPINV